MPASRKSVCEFYFHMARHTRATPAQCQRLLRYAATLQRLAEQQCNDPSWGEREYEKRSRIKTKVVEVITKIRKADNGVGQYYGATFNNDPRGCVLKIRVPDGFSDDFGQEGICVPA